MKNSLLQTDPDRDMVISFLTIRRAIGWLGIALPPVVYLVTWLFGDYSLLKPSISDYYYTVAGSILVGVLCAVALFLFTYKGPAPIDGILSGVAAIFALGVALFPCNITGHDYRGIIICRDDDSVRNGIHYISAAGFFIVLSIMSLWLFRKTHPGQKAKGQKKNRNNVYLICGIIMLLAMAVILSLKAFHLGDRLAA